MALTTILALFPSVPALKLEPALNAIRTRVGFSDLGGAKPQGA